jgi:hypothetical protein
LSSLDHGRHTPGKHENALDRHWSLWSSFRQNRLGARENGKAINDIQEIRQLADYLPAEVPWEKAEWAVKQAATFVSVVKALPMVSGFGLERE